MSVNQQVCGKCGSEKVIPKVHIKDRTERSTDYRLTAVVDEHPHALMFKGPCETTLRANVCGVCGYAEFYVDAPSDLWETYQKRLANLKK